MRVALLLAGLARAADPTVDELLRTTDDLTRGASSVATFQMEVRTANYERTMVMKAWSKGTDKSLVRIESPAKEAGVSTLKVDDNIWNYLPKVDRTMKIPAGMMSGSWMGSHFSNDDLVQGSRLSEDYTATLVASPSGGQGVWEIALVPKPEAPVVWGKVVLRVGPDRVPVDVRYFDEKGVLERTMSWSDPVTLDGRTVPRVMTLVPADAPAEYTRLTYLELDFDVQLDDSLFTLQSLK